MATVEVSSCQCSISNFPPAIVICQGVTVPCFDATVTIFPPDIIVGQSTAVPCRDLETAFFIPEVVTASNIYITVPESLKSTVFYPPQLINDISIIVITSENILTFYEPVVTAGYTIPVQSLKTRFFEPRIPSRRLIYHNCAAIRAAGVPCYRSSCLDREKYGCKGL